MGLLSSARKPHRLQNSTEQPWSDCARFLGRQSISICVGAVVLNECVSYTSASGSPFISVEDLPSNGWGLVQLLFLTLVYGYILYVGSNLISDGSEFLLLTSWSKIVGSVVIPVFGAIPDGALVLFSGLGKNAQSQLDVGVGALAGSTVMLLTIPFYISAHYGRVDVVDGVCKYKNKPKLSGQNSYLFGEGVEVQPSALNSVAVMMMVSSISYWIIQIPGFFYMNEDDEEASKHEKYYALTAFLTCLGFFCYYCYSEYTQDSDEVVQQELEDRAAQKSLEKRYVDLSTVVYRELKKIEKEGQAGYGTVADGKMQLDDGAKMRLTRLIKPFFHKYDVDRSGKIELSEMTAIMRDLGTSTHPLTSRELFDQWDLSHQGALSLEQFVDGVANLIISKRYTEEPEVRRTSASLLRAGGDDEDEDEDGSEEESMPEDLVSLSPDEQQREIWLRASIKLFLGTLLVVVFSDPMVDVMDEIGDRLDIGDFYVAFVIAPIASNASELIASVHYASKKTRKSMLIGIQTLYGAAVMNNTFTSAVFFLIIYLKDLDWTFSAEVLSIFAVECCMFVVSFLCTFRMIEVAIVLSLYPLCIILVYILNTYADLG